MQFRCFSASQEAVFTNARKQRWHNYDSLKRLKTNTPAIVELIQASLPSSMTKLRLHVSGDFYSQAYFDSWLQVATERPTILFYAYTKSLPYWVARIDQIPPNLVLTASRGGRKDNLIEKYGLKSVRVVFSVAEAESLGLEIDHDDSHAYNPGPSFALLIHGHQPKGSDAAKAKNALKGLGSYPKRGMNNATALT